MKANGFTLIEAMVALAILAIAAAGLIRAAEANVDTIRNLELRAAADWVAQNRLAELRIAGASAPLPATVKMLDHDWAVGTEQRSSQDRDIAQVVVTVKPASGSGPTVTLRGFVDRGTVSP